MKTKREAIDYCLGLPGAYEDYPFDDGEWTVMRHRENRKSFCMIFLRDFLRRAYDAVIPAYHMNKVHWNSVILDGSVPEEEIFRMIWMSFNLTRPPLPKASRHRENM